MHSELIPDAEVGIVDEGQKVTPCPEGKFLREHLGSVTPLPTSPMLNTPAPTHEELWQGLVYP